MKKSLLIVGALGIVLVVVGLWAVSKNHKSASVAGQSPFSLAMDWTPNTNHTGIYVAMKKGWYKDQGLDLKLLPYSASATTDTLVSARKADVGISSTESIVADAGAGSPVVSIAAITAHNTSILAVRQDSGITSPKQLEGKQYGGFGAPYETAVIGQTIKHDGGSGEFKNVTLSEDPVEVLKSKQVDFVWVFAGWEGIQAKREGLSLKTFPITENGVPDYSTPNIITSPTALSDKKQLLQKFMVATAKGYEFARTHPDEAAQILLDSVPAGTFSDPGLVKESQEYLSPKYQDAGKPWGIQSAESWRAYPQFMLDHKAVVDASGKLVEKLKFSELYTNELLR